MAADPGAWAEILQAQGPLGLALIVLVAVIAASITVIGLLIRYILKDERIPTTVWAEECKVHSEIREAVDVLADAVKETTLTLRLLFSKVGGGL